MKLSKGQILYRQGDTADSLYVITAGKIGLFSNGPRGPTEIARLGPGQIIGDLSFFTGSLRTSDAIALADSEFSRVSYETMRSEFAAAPVWVQKITKTLATQVQSYSTEIKPLRDHEDGGGLSRLIIARAWAALTMVSQQFGSKTSEGIVIDWPTLRSLSNLCFREISDRVLQLALALEPHGFCTIRKDGTGPLDITLTQPQVFADFLIFYTRAIVQNNPELNQVRPIEYETLRLLASPQLKTTSIHRGQVEIDLMQFKSLASASGFPEITATSVDLLGAYGLEITKSATETGVKIRFHQQEIVSRAKFWKILRVIDELSQGKKVPGAA